jgi:hypothetical protein
LVCIWASCDALDPIMKLFWEDRLAIGCYEGVCRVQDSLD